MRSKIETQEQFVWLMNELTEISEDVADEFLISLTRQSKGVLKEGDLTISWEWVHGCCDIFVENEK